MDCDNTRSDTRQDALRNIMLRQSFRIWSSKANQERQHYVNEVQSLFTSISNSSTDCDISEKSIERPITRRPGVEEVRNCMLLSGFLSIPQKCDSLRGEIWQVLLNVYKRNQHGTAAQEFERMIQRLAKLPRNPLLVSECEEMSHLLVSDDDEKRRQLQNDLEILLIWFISTKSVEYASGMARVVGVFFLVNLPLSTVYDCFYQFCVRFIPRFVVPATVGSPFDLLVSSGLAKLQSQSTTTGQSEEEPTQDNNGHQVDEEHTEKALRIKRIERQQLAEQLLSYHAPRLCHVLSQWCPRNEWSEPGNLIPENLFMDDVYNALIPQHFLYVMDQFLLTGDAMFGLFIIIAALIATQDKLLLLGSKDEVHTVIRQLFATTALQKEGHMQSICVLASKLHQRTPTTYKCSLQECNESFCGSRKATIIAFNPEIELSVTKLTPNRSKRDVDISQWEKRESRSIAGKHFWFHVPTGRTQWEHPAEEFDPPPAQFALPVSVQEVATQLMGEKRGSMTSIPSITRSESENNNQIRYFVVDVRGLRSSVDLKSGRIPAAFTLDPSVFDSPEMIERNMKALDAMKSLVHIVLVGNGVGIPPSLIKDEDICTSVRDAVRHDIDGINRAALFFQKRGFRYISCLDGGYSSWHAFTRDDPVYTPDELLGHVEDECHYCRYDTIERTGIDPAQLKKKEIAKTRRKKPDMPTTTSLLVNGGEGDVSILSTNVAPPTSAGIASTRLSLSSSLSMTRTSMRNIAMSSMNSSSISTMRNKLSDVKIPKLGGWKIRGPSMPSTEPVVAPSHSCQETSSAIAKDGNSDGGSLDSETINTVNSVKSPKESFIGVFTIDDCDDDDGHDHELVDPADLAKDLDELTAQLETMSSSFTTTSA